MENPTGIKQMIIGIVKKCSKPASIEEGYIKSINPLKIGLTNDDKMTLSDTDIVVSSKLEEELGKGDKLYLLVLNNGKLFYILDKV